ncbi:MAG: large-conductance mechanosensitive channel protein MscL [Phycisphaeraceae bacterium]|nr:large-conductance mechanosensitive channel protein MscL [Phycisphaeraceae bacterium]
MGIFKEFRDFAMRGNVVDMAVGIVIGGAFGTIVRSMVDDVLMPPIGMALGEVDFSELKFYLQRAGTTEDGAQIAEVAIRYGSFINAMISFIIVAFALFIVIKAMNTARARFEKKEDEAKPVAATPEDVLVLREIRDLLQKQG